MNHLRNIQALGIVSRTSKREQWYREFDAVQESLSWDAVERSFDLASGHATRLGEIVDANANRRKRMGWNRMLVMTTNVFLWFCCSAIVGWVLA